MRTWDNKFRNSDTYIMYIFRLKYIWDKLKMSTKLVKLYVQIFYMILLSLMVYNAHTFLQASQRTDYILDLYTFSISSIKSCHQNVM
jgi:hypothetical protein